jgi:Transglutaminase-like superfamily
MDESLGIYRQHSRWTDPGRHASWLREVAPTPDTIARHLPGLLMHCLVARLRGVPVPEIALRDVEVRTAEGIVDRVVARDGRPANAAREPAARFFGICSHFALLATAVFRTHGVPARVRAGFARYFVADTFEDHWVAEYWDGAAWRLLDAQLDDTVRSMLRIEFPAWDVPRDQFLDASTVWCRLRAGEIDPERVGVTAVALTGAWFAAQSLLRDVAALNKEEMLPWDTWGRGREVGPQAREVPADLAGALDPVAHAVADDPSARRAVDLYRREPWLRRTPSIFTLDFPTGWPDGVPAEVAP